MKFFQQDQTIRLKPWEEKAKEFVDLGEKEKAIKKELFNHAWRATSKILIDKLNVGNKDYVLDAGCGWGRILIGLKYHLHNIRIDGIELTKELSELAQNLLCRFNLQNGINILQSDLIKYDLGQEKYDSFYSIRVLHYIEEKEFMIDKFYKCLKKKGKGIVILPNRYCPYRLLTYKHAPLYPISKIKKYMEIVGFKNVKTGGYKIIPDFLNIQNSSKLCYIDDIFYKIPIINYVGGLAYAVGEK